MCCYREAHYKSNKKMQIDPQKDFKFLGYYTGMINLLLGKYAGIRNKLLMWISNTYKSTFISFFDHKRNNNTLCA